MSDIDTDDNVLLLTEKVQDVEVEKEAKVWTFQGVHGGAGVTSLVVQLAYDLSIGGSKIDEILPDVLVIDLDFERGSCSSYLDVSPSMKIEELNAAAGRMDDALAQTFIRKCGENLQRVLSWYDGY